MARVLVSLLVVGMTAVAAAQNPDGAKLFEEGRALAKDGKYVEACERFEKSLAIDPAVGTKLNYADCHEHLGHFWQAYQLFDEAAEADKATNPDRSKFARERANALAGKLGTVIVKLASPDAPGLTVTIGGRPAKPAAEIRVLVEPGDVKVEVSSASGAFDQVARASAGTTVVIDVPGTEEAPVQAQPDSGRHSRLVIAYTVGGIGIVGLATGVILGVKANSDYDAQISSGHCTNDSPPRCDATGFAAQGSAVTLANVGTVLGIGGLALIATGAVIYFTAPKDVVITPTATAQSAGVSVVGRF